MSSEFDVVCVVHGANLEHANKFVLAAVERSHPGVGLRPNDEIQGNEAEFRGRRVNNRRSAPVDEGAADAAVTKVGPSSSHPPFVKHEELGVGHFARGHRELAMMNLTETADITFDRDIVWWIGEDLRRLLSRWQVLYGLNMLPTDPGRLSISAGTMAE